MRQSRKLLFLAAAALLIRLVINGLWMEAADTANYHRVAVTLAEGGRLYRDTPGIYPYPPPWALAEAAAHWLGQRTNMPFVFWVKLLPAVFDLGIAFLLAALARRLGKSEVLFFCLYAFNPAAILVSAMHGQFDSLPVFFMLLACWLLEFERKSGGSAAALALGIAVKAFPVLLLPFMLIRLPDGRSRARYAVIALGPVALLLLPFLVADAPALFNQLFGYQGVVDYGLLAIVEEVYRLALRQPLPLAGGVVLTVGKVIFGLMYAAVVFESWKQRRQPGMIFTIRAAALVFLAFYLVYPGISSQYLLWLLPFALALSTRSAIVYSAAAAAALVSYYAFHYPEILLNSVTRPGQPEALHILYIACLAGFWLACAWLLAQYNRLQPASPAESQQA